MTTPSEPVELIQAEFEREERYIVIKRKHLAGETERDLRADLAEAGIPTIGGVVVESDWPEYETVWKLIEARVTRIQHTSEPSGDPFATLEEWEHEDQRELSLLYNHRADDSLQFNRGQMRTAIRHGRRIAAKPSAPSGEGITDREIKAVWNKHGGEQHGPIVEQYSIEERAFYRFARDLLTLSTPRTAPSVPCPTCDRAKDDPEARFCSDAFHLPADAKVYWPSVPDETCPCCGAPCTSETEPSKQATIIDDYGSEVEVTQLGTKTYRHCPSVPSGEEVERAARALGQHFLERNGGEFDEADLIWRGCYGGNWIPFDLRRAAIAALSTDQPDTGVGV